MSDTDTPDTQTPTPNSDADTPVSPTTADLLASPQGQIVVGIVTIANGLPHLGTGEAKRMFAYNAVSEFLPYLSRSEVYFLIELAVKSLKESN